MPAVGLVVSAGDEGECTPPLTVVRRAGNPVHSAAFRFCELAGLARARVGRRARGAGNGQAMGNLMHMEQLSGLLLAPGCLAPTRARGEFGTHRSLNFLRNRCRPPPARGRF